MFCCKYWGQSDHMCGFHPQPPLGPEMTFFCVFWQKLAFFISRQLFWGLLAGYRNWNTTWSQPRDNMLAIWRYNHDRKWGQPPFLWPLFDLVHQNSNNLRPNDRFKYVQWKNVRQPKSRKIFSIYRKLPPMTGSYPMWPEMVQKLLQS